MDFEVEAANDVEFTLELEAGTEYDITIGGENAGRMKTNLGGKLSIGVELDEGVPVKVSVKKA